MNFHTISEQFTALIDQWTMDLDGYTMTELSYKPQDGGWSLGQVYNHLIQATLQFQLKETKRCLSSDINKRRRKSFKGFLVFTILGGFPNTRIKVPPSKSYTPPSPASKEELVTGLSTAKQVFEALLPKVSGGTSKGKSPHPALGYLNAGEWMRLIPMHFKHHLKQKARLDDELYQVHSTKN